MRPTFGGDAIDRMLEQGSYRSGPTSRGGYNAVPPPQQQNDTSNHSRPRYDRYDRGRGRGRGGERGGGRGGRRRSRSRDRNRGNGGGRGRGGYGERRGGGGYGGRGRGRGRGPRNHRGNNNDYYNHRPRSLSPADRHLTREEEESRRQGREQQDIERDQRTVFACQIHPKCDERDIFEFFSEVGKVIDVQLIRDNRTFKSKGLCYVEFENKASVGHALSSLSGQSLGGFPVSVQLTQAEKNRAAQQAAQTSQQSRPMKLYVTNIHKKVTEEDIRPVFSAFGEILSLEIKCDHRRKSKGYGFVEFKKEIDAIGAMQQLNDLEILGQKIKVTAADQNARSHNSNYNNQVTGPSAPNKLNQNDYDNSASYSQHQTKISEESGNGGLALSTADKLALMAKLGRGTVKPAKTTTTNSNINNQHLPSHIQPPAQYSSFNNTVNYRNNPNVSKCVLLKHMFSPQTETDPDFDLEIREDVMEEVRKFGGLLHIYVDKTAKDGLVYLKFNKPNEATMTINNLNGRWFGKNQIKASYHDEKTYNQQFQL